MWSTRNIHRISSLVNLVVILSMMFASPLQAVVQAKVWTDQADYVPGSTVTIHGDNDDDSGLLYTAGETVLVTVDGPNDYGNTCQALVDETGAWACDILLWPGLEAVGDYSYTAVGQSSGKSETGYFSDSGGSYSLNWTAADPAINNAPYLPTYTKMPPGALPCPAPSGSAGRASDPLANAVFGSPKDSVESLAPPNMALGQIVPFEVKITVNGSTAPENGVILFTPYWLTKVTSGGDFGYDPAYEVYCAFVDYGDAASVDPGANAKVDSWTDTVANVGTSNEQIQGTIQVSGLESGDTVIVEIWVVLKSTIPAGTSGNVQSGLLSAQTASGETINTGNQTVPLLRVGEFFTADADLSVTKSDSPDPVMQGTQLSYTLTATNHSPTVYANGVMVTDTLDPNTTFVSSSPAICSAVGSVVTCTVGALAPGQVYPITIVTNVSYTAPATNDPSTNPETGTCTAAGPGVDLCNRVSIAAITDDPVSGNNTDSEPTNVLASAAAIDIQKTPDTQAVSTGGTANFTIVVTNMGNVPLSNVAVSDPLVPGCSSTIGTLAVGGSSTYTCSLANVTSNFTNVATATGSYGPTTVTDTDDAAVVVDFLPTVDLTKTAAPLTLVEPGGFFTYTLTILNTSSEPVTITALTDDNSLSQQCLDLIGDTLAANASKSCTYTISRTEPGMYNNTANVTVQDSSGNPASDTATATVTVTNLPPDISVTKMAGVESVPETGGMVTFTYTVTNNSTEAATITALSDDKFGVLAGDADCAVNTVLAGGASCSFDAAFAIPAGDFPGSHVNVFTATAADNDGASDTASDDATVAYTDVLPTVTLEKSVTPAELAEPGGVFTYTLLITNTSLESVTITALTDSNLLSQQCLDLVNDVLPANGTATCTYTVSQSLVGSYPNTATVSVADDDTNTASATDTASVAVTNVLPTVTLDKSVTPAILPEPGGVFTYTLTIHNTSIEPVTITALTDDNSLSAECSALEGTELAVGASTSCTYTVTHTEQGTYPNTAHVTVTDNEISTATAMDSETVSVTDEMPVISVTKTANPTSVPETGMDVVFTYVVTNGGLEAVNISSLSDDIFGPLTGDTDCKVGTNLNAGASCEFSITRFITGDYSGPDHTNVFTARAVDNDDNEVTATDNETVTITNVLPTVDLDKSVSPATRVEPGGVFTYTLTVTNTSEELVTITALTDSNPLSAGCEALVGTTLAAGAHTSCTYTLTRTEVGSYDNTASVTVEDNDATQASDSDDANITVTNVEPSVTLDKTVDVSSMPEPGGVFQYTLTITNNSVEPVEITALTDSNPLSASCTALIGTTLAAGASTSCTYPVIRTDAGSYTNTANVTVEDNDGGSASDSDSETVTVTDVMPTVDLTKSVDPLERMEPGGLFTYTLTIHNTSVEPVEITALTDTNTLSASCTALVGTTLAADASASCTYTATYTNAGTYPNTANVSVADNENNPASDTASAEAKVLDALPEVMLEKAVTPSTLPEPGGVFHFTLTITNNSVESVTITALADDNPLPAVCTDLIDDVLTPGQSVQCAYDVTHTEPDSYANTATVTVEDNEGNAASDTDSETVTVTSVAPAVTLDKAVTPSTLAEPGGLFTYTLTVTNNSVETVTITALTDDNALSQECLDLIGDPIPAGGTASCIYTVTQTEAGSYPNTASVLVTDNDGETATASDSETVTVTDVKPVVDLVKDVTPASMPEPGGAFTYTLTITNNSVETVTITALTDDNPLPVGCTDLVGTTLAAGASTDCTYTVTHTEQGSYENTASVTVADNENNTASDTDSETVTVEPVAPVVDLVKSVTPATLAEPGGVFTYTLTINNNSVEPVIITALTDDNTLSQACLDLIGDILPVGGTASCTYDVTRTEAGNYANTASVTVTDNDGQTASDSDDETVTVTGVAPTVMLLKSATPHQLYEPGGVFTYTLTITNSAVEPVTITALTDDNALSAECLALVNTTLAVGASTSCSYTVTQTEAGVYPNTASVTVVDNEGIEAGSTATADVQVMDVLPKVDLTKDVTPLTLAEPGGVFHFTLTITNNSVENVTITALTDDNPLPAACTDLIADVLTPGQSVNCIYDVTHIEKGAYNNTASVTVEDNENNTASDSDTETVTVTDVLPTVTLVKTASPLTLPEPGGVFTYTLEISNLSAEPVTLTALNDNAAALSAECLALVNQTLQPNQVVSCQYEVTYTNAGVYPNIASVDAEDNDGNTATASDDASVEVTNQAPVIEITKTADPTHVPETGGDVTFTFVVENLSVETVTLTALNDNVFGDLNGKGTCVVPQTIPAAGSYTCTYTVALSSDTLTAHIDVVTATATDNDGSTATDEDDATVTFDNIAPTLEVTKTANPTSVPETGGLVQFTFVVHNTSTEAVTITSLDDSVYGTLDGDADCAVNTVLAVGASCEFSITRNVAGDFGAPDHTNVFTAIAVDNDGATATDEDNATVHFNDVAPAISIVKTADPTSLPETGGNVTFTFVVTNDGQEPVTLTSLTDTIFGDLDEQGTCVTGGLIPVGGSYTCAVTEFLSSDSLASHYNVVTATAVDDDNTPATGTDDETVTFTGVEPSIRVTKTADRLSIPETGADVTFTFLVENIGQEDVTLNSLVDDQFGDLDGQGNCDLPQTILIGGSYTCAITEFLSSDSLVDHKNVVTASAVDDDGTPASDSDDETVTFTDVAPAITITKTANPTSVPETGADVTFTFLVQNTGLEDVTLTALTDTVFGNLAGQGNCAVPQTIAVGGSYSCTVNRFLSSDSLTHHYNVATATAVDDDETPATDTDDETVTFDDVAPKIQITKTASPAVIPETGADVTFTFLVQNTGLEDVTLTALTDTVFGNLAGQGNCAVPQTIAIGGSYSCTVTKFLASDSLAAHTNVATATAVDDDDTSATDDDEETVTFDDVAPAITITKTASPTHVPETGGDVTFTFVVQNTGLEDVSLTVLNDTVFGDLNGKGTCVVPQIIAVGGSYTCAYTVNLTSDSLAAHKNVVTATAVDDDDTPASDTDDETVTFDDVAPAIRITKTANPNHVPETGGNVTFTFLVENIGQEAVTLTTLNDTVFGNLDGKGTCDVPQTIAIGGSYACEYTVLLSSSDMASHKNVVTATAVDDDNTPATDDDDETVTFDDALPTVDLTKTVDSNATFNVGNVATYTLTIKNTSLEPVTITALTDTHTLPAACTDLIGATLQPGASVSCSYTIPYNATGVYPNTASVTVEDGEDNPASDTAEQTVQVYAPVVSKTANGTYSEVHDWEVFKTVNTTWQYGLPGQKLDFIWTVRVDETTHGENYNVSGVITVVNPNPDDPMTMMVNDVLDDGSVANIGPCTNGTLTGKNLTVPAGKTATCNYSVSPSGDPLDFGSALPDQVTMSVEYGYAGGPSYFPVTTVSNGGALDGTYEGWCADIDHPIGENTNYTANVYSSYESLPAGLIENAQNLDLVNWIINQEYVGKSAGSTLGNYTYGDVQRAIWELLEDNGQATTSGLGAWNQTRVNKIKAAAVANGEGFMPTCGDVVAVILQPIGGKQLVTIAQVTFASLGVNCAETNVVTAVMNGIPFEASAGIVWTPNLVSPTATLDDNRQLDWPVTVDADSIFTYQDPVGYTCSTDLSDYPGGYYRTIVNNTAVLTYATGTDTATAYTEVKCYSPLLEVTKTANPLKVPETGGNVTFTYVVSNPGISPLTINSLSDDRFGVLAGDDDCHVGTELASKASCSFDATFAVPAGIPGKTHVNVFKAIASDQLGNPASDTDDAVVTYQQVLPDIIVTKTADKTSIPETGENVTFTFMVKNNGSETVTISYLSDSTFGTLAGDDDCKIGTVLVAGASCEFSVTKFIKGDYGVNHYNKFTAKAADNDGNTDTAYDDETVVFTDVSPDISVTKTADPITVPEPGAYVKFTYTVTNNTLEPAKITYLNDSKFGSLVGDTDCKVGITLAAGASCQFMVSKKISGDAGFVHTNIFTAKATDGDNNTAVATDDATVTVTDVLPTIQVNKTASPTTVLFTGGNVKFTVTVKNTSVEPVTLTSLVDDKFGNLNGQGTCITPKTIAVGGTYTCYFTKTISSPLTVFQTIYHIDTVTGTAVDNENNTATDDGSATVKFYWRGRTPGYWKTHASGWPKFNITNYKGAAVSILTTKPVLSVFNVPQSLLKCTGTSCILDLNKDGKNDTLIQALAYKGGSDLAGKTQILLRAAVSALLNEQYFKTGYPPYGSVNDLLNAVNATLATQDEQSYVTMASELDWWNNGVH